MSKETTKIVLNLHICLVLAAVVCLTIVSCENEPKPAPGKGRIVGKVTDIEGRSISNCLVSLNDGASIVLTDQDGRYAFEDVEPKSSYIRLIKRCYQTLRNTPNSFEFNVLPDSIVRRDIILTPAPPTADSTDPNFRSGREFAEQELSLGYASWFVGGENEIEWSNPNRRNSFTGLPAIDVGSAFEVDAHRACIAGHNDRILQYIDDNGLPPYPRWWRYSVLFGVWRRFINTNAPGFMRVAVNGKSVMSSDSNTVLATQSQDDRLVFDITHRGTHFQVDLGRLSASEFGCNRVEDSLDILMVANPRFIIDLRTGQVVPTYHSGSINGYPPDLHLSPFALVTRLPSPMIPKDTRFQ